MGMPPLPLRRNSLCLFCSFAARSQSQVSWLVPRTQIAHRSGAASSRSSGRQRAPGSPATRRLEFAKSPEEQGRQKDAVHVIVKDKLTKLKDDIADPAFLQSLQLSNEDFSKEWLAFERFMSEWVRKPTRELSTLVGEASKGKNTLETHLRYLFYAQVFGGRFTAAELANQKEVADLRYPAEWYPATRRIPRTVHMHVGPTNSGKTYHALKRLEEAPSGIYLGPLRLLAHEVYTRLNAKGKVCALVTGEEQRMPETDKPLMFSCTVEMAPLNTLLDVAVIDEIQMINHPDRGWAWTQAFLGLQVREVHLCGEARTVPMMRELCALVGDELHVHNYERLTPLKVEPISLGGGLTKLEKGDCIVAFTVIGIHALRKEIERKTGKQCAIVYGSLPPETRAQQARLFNDPDNDYDFLVASDAIGMGLNLAIKRVIFESTTKYNGTQWVPLEISDIKQIAGRAGRFKTAHQAVNDDQQRNVTDTAVDPAIGLDDAPVPKEADPTVGWVTTLDQVDHPYLKQAMKREPTPIKTAGLSPPSLIVERFANYFPPGTPFSYIMLRLHEISEISPRFHLCTLKDQLRIADVIHSIKDLTIQDRIAICAAPLGMRNSADKSFLHELAECIALNKDANLLNLKTLDLEVMDIRATGKRQYLYDLESLHKHIVCYLWLSYRFPNIFTTRTLANYAKKILEDQIERTLTQFSIAELKKQREKRKALAEQVHQVDNSDIEDPDDINQGDSPPPSGLAAEARDIFNSQALKEPPPSTDDMDEYPEKHILVPASTHDDVSADKLVRYTPV
ncbi:P-loop containing nucleoside triphosphate hydrolase protein [Phaeosphaeria sp. MPI-PUGE-AT-0046c]|nr:P-loop containing nucleoside triphosphate hydrolase protein [Phaeosphaeria sp. MPI-PUGE-AT-0046c]